ncbi:MAG: phosphoenolpyruvate--protein phosphotransferase [Legionellales bacterium]|nr:phosphoenolpyruvate--protein phosphotransferase [Legionellales bacterium]
MLTTLRRIQQDADNSPDIFHVLQSVVKAVRNEINANCCNIFLFDDEKQEYVLFATDGSNPAAVNQLRIPHGKGLISLIAERAEPLNIDDATTHPQFFAHAMDADEPYHGFLGAPLIHRKQTLGVIVTQKTAALPFDAEEEAFLITLCAQLAGTIAQARASGHFSALLRGQVSGKKVENITLKGIPCVSGVVTGQATVIYPQADLSAVPDQIITDIENELVIFEHALHTCRKEIDKFRQRLGQSLPPQELALFDAYLGMLDDNGLGNEIRNLIHLGISAQTALRDVISTHEQHFAIMDDVYLQERSADIRSLGQRLLACLQEQELTTRIYPANTILVGDEISATDLAEVPNDRLVGVVSGKGSINSHIAILARALGIPAVLGVEGLPLAELDKQEVIVDGNTGHIYIAASTQLRQAYLAQQAQEQQSKADLLYLRDLPAETLDGHRISLRVNIGLMINRGSSLRLNAEGVGLFRSEVAFFGRDRFPTEEEQRVIYRQILAAYSPRPVVMRTLDIGGDKTLAYFGIKEDNPALGWRGIRVTLDHPEVFLVQIRAMLRASEGLSNLQIMLPMISMASEIDEAKRLISRAYNELQEAGLTLSFPALGAMIEVPAAVYQARQLAEKVDFLSIGSNDLIQYLLAVDRNNAYVAHLYQSLHPAVLRALHHAVQECKKAGKWISICGEMASNPTAVPLLIAMGFDCLSMHSANLLQVKSLIRDIHMDEAKELLNIALNMDNAADISRFIMERTMQNDTK